jgi:hypothetical protein
MIAENGEVVYRGKFIIFDQGYVYCIPFTYTPLLLHGYRGNAFLRESAHGADWYL